MPDITWTVPSGFQAATPLAQTVLAASDITTIKQVAAGATGNVTASSTVSAAPRGSLKLSLVIKAAAGTGTNPDPTPPPPPVTTDPTAAQIGTSSSFTITAINPTNTDYPGGRGPNQLVLYRSPVTITVTNEFGCEVAVNSSNVITAVNDRQPTASGTGTSVPSGGYVLSGHGTARDWLNSNATVSATVTLLTAINPDPNPTPPPTGGSGGYPVRAIAVYKMMWSSSGAYRISTMNSHVNVVRLAFGQGSPPTLVGYGPEGASTFKADVAAAATAGKRIVLSIGGSGGAVNTSNRTAFMQGVASAFSDLSGNLHGIDWDVEASGLNQSDVVWISTQCKQIYGAGFGISFAPNGGNVSQYLPTAVACYNAGACDDYGQQFYDSNVSLSAAKGRISEALGAGLPQSVMSVGMMIDPAGGNWWTNDQCRTYFSDIRSTWPGITKAYLWEGSRGGTDQWCNDMAQILGI